MKDNRKSESQIEQLLDELKEVPERNPKAASRGRSRFLSEAVTASQAVSRSKNNRLSIWKPFTQKDNFAMKTILTIVVLAGLVFGGAGTVYAAQDDLPTEPLYPIKTLSEDIRLGLSSDPQQKFDTLSELIQTRTGEIAQLAEQGIAPPEPVTTRLSNQSQQMLQLAAGMDAAGMDAALLQLQTQLQSQTQLMTQLQSGATGETAQALEQTRSMLQERLRLVETGIADPEGFRHTVRNETLNGQDDATEPGYGNGADGEATPGNGNGFGNETSDSGSGNGGTQGNGNGSGSGNGQGQGGKGSGNGNQVTLTPTPDGLGNGGNGKGGNGQGGKP